MVADDLAKLRDFLWQECEQRPEFWKRSSQEPNGRKLAKAVGVHPTTITRVLKLERGTIKGNQRIRPLRRYRMSAELLDGLAELFDYGEDEIEGAIRRSKPAPPPCRKPK